MKHIFTNSNESAVVRNGYRCAKVARPLRTVFLIGTLLLSLGVGQMWAGPSFSGGYAYFYNKGGWSDNSKQLCIGRDKWGDDWTEVRTMTAIPNTKLWYNSLPTSGWGDATYMAVIGNSSAWGSNNWGSGNLTNANHRTGAVSLGDWGFGSGNVNMLTPASGNNDATLALSYVGNAYSSLNKTITIKAKVSTNNGSSYTETTTPAALDGASKVFTSYTSCAGTSGASATLSVGSSSTTFKAGYTATTTLTAPSTDPSGYKFAGWYDSDGSLVGATASSKTATVYPTADATYYAYYRKLYTISAGTTIVWDLAGNDANSGNSPWSSVYLYKDIEGSSASNDAFTQCGSSTQYAKNYASAVSNVKLFLFREVNTGTWNTYKQTTDIYSDVSGVTLFTYCNSTTYSDSKYKLDWQKTSPAYKAANGQTVYFDNTSTQWAQPKFKYGTQWFNRYVDMEQVPGTANLWKYTMPHDLYYGKYKIADEFGWTDYNNIDEDHCSHYTASQAASITSATTVIPSTNGAPCITSILNGYTRTVTISAPSNGTITVTYTDIDNSAQEQTSGSFNVAQTCIITVSASPNSGYVLSSLTVGGNAFTSGNTYTVWANTTISATFAAETTHNVDVSYICTDTEAAVKSGSTTAVGETTASTFEAGTPNGFSFTRWVVGDGLTITAGSTSTNSISVKTKASGTYTLRAEYTEVLTTSWYISGATGGGSPFSGSGTSGTSMSKKTGHSAEEIYYCTISVGTVATGSGFSFNPYNSSESKNYGNASANITKANNSADVYGDNSTALHFLPYVTGDYEFKLDNTGAHPVLTVTWPVYNQLRISAASPTDATNTGNYDLSDQGSNNWAVTRTLNAKTTYTFKMMYDSEWFGNSGNFTRASSSATNIGNTGNMTVRTDAAGDYTFTFNSSSYNFSITYPTAYTVTFGSDGHGTVTATATSAGGSMTSGDCVANNDVVTFAQTPNTGYSLKGWYTTVDGNTSAGLNGSNQLTINAAKTVYAQYNANNYTVTFNATANGGSCATASKSVTFDSPYGELPEATKAAQRFAGWFTTASGEGTQVTAETIVSTASDHILYARFEETYRVQVDYKCGSTTLRSSSEVHASATTVSAEISAPEILGYRFSGWTGSNVTFADASSATTTIHATTATTVTANYTAVPMVYFKNNLDWDDVYVSFNCGWATVGGKQVPTNNGKPYYKMEQLGNSDIFYCEIPSTYTASDYADWQGNIAFDNKGFGDGVSTHIGNSNSFWKGEFLGRGDFDPKATMFIPYNGATETRNEGTYYTRGCWIQYNSNYSGYKVRVNTYVQGGGGSEEANVELTASVAGATEFTAKVYLDDADYTYGLMLYKDYQKNSSNLWYTNVNDAAHTITSATTSLPWAFEPCDDSWQRCRVKTEAVGDYIVTVSFATGIPMVNIEYPVTVGDFRLKYTDAATWSNDAHDASWYHLSRVIKHANNAVDTVSFFVSYGSTPAIELQKCTNISDQGVETWTDQSTVSLTSITEAGVYNFKITQSANASSATVACIGEYSGNYYIRTDASDGGWSNYSDGVNDMTYSEYSLTHGGSTGRYSHYFMRHVNNGSNIKFCIANDYSMCISDTLVNDEYANEWIEREANVRFMWYSETNQISRAYISGSSIVSDRFLVLEGDAHLYNASGQALTTGNGRVAGLNEYEMNFIDDQNWVYEATVKADPKERIKLTAKFGTNVQYFYGKEGDRSDDNNTHQLIGGTTGGPYKIRVVYDFKTNRLVSAWLPDGNVTTEFQVEADVMIIRYHQADAQQITFNASGKLKDVKTVYGTMQFNKYRLNNQDESTQGDLGLSPYERDLYFISFPFDVKLNDVFGFGTYGKHWIIEYYDGKTRAEKGFWKDSPSNWKFVTKAMKDEFTLKANEGYVLALDLDELGLSSPVWDFGVENVYLYFPSTASVDKIQATTAKVDIVQTGYECTINRGTPDGDRRIKDSYWHLLGVPSYANAAHTTNGDWDDEEPTVPGLEDPADWTSTAPFVYEWDPSSNEYNVVSSSSYTFKPMRAYLAQYARDTIYWSQVNAKPASIVARREANEIQNYEFRLAILKEDQELDHTFINLRDDENVTNAFDFNYDLSKYLEDGFTSKNNLYTLVGYERLAANNLPLEAEKTTVIPVGMIISAEGEYTFSMPEGTNGIGVTLVDNETGDRTNLALGDYTVTLAKGTIDERFVLEISPAKTPTGMEEVTGDGLQVTGARKVMVDGMLYIVKDGKVFDARGARCK